MRTDGCGAWASQIEFSLYLRTRGALAGTSATRTRTTSRASRQPPDHMEAACPLRRLLSSSQRRISTRSWYCEGRAMKRLQGLREVARAALNNTGSCWSHTCWQHAASPGFGRCVPLLDQKRKTSGSDDCKTQGSGNQGSDREVNLLLNGMLQLARLQCSEKHWAPQQMPSVLRLVAGSWRLPCSKAFSALPV